MKLKKSILLTLALAYSLSAVGCGGKVNSGAAGDLASSLTGPTGPGSLSPISSEGGLTPLEPIEDGSGEELLEEEFVEEEFVDEELPADEEILDEEFPAEEEFVDEELPTEEDAFSEELPADEELLEDEGGLDEIPELSPEDALPGSSLGGGESADGYANAGSFKVDQDRFNQWRAMNLVSDGSNIYVTAVDIKSPTKGTVIKMGTSGEGWTDLGAGLVSKFSLGAFGYDMNKTIQGVALDGSGNLVVNDTSSSLFSIDASTLDITEKTANINDSFDIVESNGSYYVATAIGIQKFDSSLSASTSFGALVPTGGMGKDSQGNLFAVIGNGIQKLDESGEGTQVIADLSAPLDVSVDSEGNIFVLEADQITFYNASGESQGSFGTGEFTAPKAIFVDNTGSVYVADNGTSHTDSKVLKFTKGGA